MNVIGVIKMDRKEIEKRIKAGYKKRKKTGGATRCVSPKSDVPKDILRRKLREKIELKGMSRITKKQKEKMLSEEMTNMGVDMKKFKEALSTLSMEGKFDATLTKN